jgi:hypothetical protein
VNIRAGCPGIDEEADGYERGGDDAYKEVVFEFAEGAVVETREDAVF